MITDLSKIDFSKFKKINVVGTTGSGKTTVAKTIAKILNQPHIEIDQIFWGPNWQKPTNRDFYDRLKLSLENSNAYVLDGNYTKTNSLKLSHVQTVVWLNLPLNQNFFQLVKRTLARLMDRTELWPGTGNTESIYSHLFTKDSIFYWFLKTYKGNQIAVKALAENPQWSHLQFIELTSPAQIQEFLHHVRNFAKIKK